MKTIMIGFELKVLAGLMVAVIVTGHAFAGVGSVAMQAAAEQGVPPVGATQAIDAPMPVAAAGPLTIQSLMQMTPAALDALYAKSPAGPMPCGASHGVASSDPGSAWGDFNREFFSGLWQGKVFDCQTMTLRNRTPLGMIADAKLV